MKLSYKRVLHVLYEYVAQYWFSTWNYYECIDPDIDTYAPELERSIKDQEVELRAYINLISTIYNKPKTKVIEDYEKFENSLPKFCQYHIDLRKLYQEQLLV